MLTDVRFAIRLLARSPRFALAAIATLALGIGATTAVYAVVDAVLLKPFPYRNPERIVAVRIEAPDRGQTGVSAGTVAALRELPAVEAGALRITHRQTLSGGDRPLQVLGEAVNHDFFAVFGIGAALGRTFAATDTPGDRLLVLSDALWRSAFGARPDIIGQVARLNGEPYPIVGVMPAGFETPDHGQLWTLVPLTAGELTRLGSGPFRAYARLRSANLEGARAEAATLASRVVGGHGEQGKIAFVPLLEPVATFWGAYLTTLFAAVSVVLLIACANVANLLVARAAGRARELLVKVALGASRARLLRQLLLEGLVLALAAAAAGLGLAWVLVRLAPALGMPDIERIDHTSVDWRAAGFTIGISAISAALFALAPAAAAVRGATSATHSSTSRGGRRTSQMLIAAECAVTLALIIASVLLLGRLQRVLSVDVGFETRTLRMASLNPAGPEHRATNSMAFYRRVIEEVERATGSEAALFSRMPLDTILADAVEIRTGSGEAARTFPARMRTVSPGAFRLIGVPVISGREFGERDRSGPPGVAVVNETLARRVWGAASPLGTSVEVSSDWGTNPVQIVGIVRDFRDHVSRAARPEIYLSAEQQPSWMATIVVRSTRPPEELTDQLRAAVQRVDPDEAVSDAVAVSTLLARQTASNRFVAALLSAFALFAVLLAASGIIAVVAASISRRTREIGIRVAVGAAPRDVLVLMMKDAMVAVGIGVLVGLVLAYNQWHLLRRLTAVDRFDPVIYAAAAGALLVFAIGAAWFPARAALRVDPVIALRSE